MTPPLLLVAYTSTVAYTATTAGIYTAGPVRVRTLKEARTARLPVPAACTCTEMECDFCWLRGDHDFNRAQDI
jgi:hypothetical protein